MSKTKHKRELFEKLKQEHAFWSYNTKTTKEINDDFLIEKVLIHLDIDDIIKLYNMYPKQKIINIWEKKLLPQEFMYYNLNRFYAFWLFEIENPDKYIRNYLRRVNG